MRKQLKEAQSPFTQAVKPNRRLHNSGDCPLNNKIGDRAICDRLLHYVIVLIMGLEIAHELPIVT